jgi:hypothetical protein
VSQLPPISVGSNVRNTLVASTPFQKKLATIAQQQFGKYHLLRETEPPLSA